MHTRVKDLMAHAIATLDPHPPAIRADLQPGVDGRGHIAGEGHYIP